ncbi:hypothetical protein HK414_06560 [Ramlibacter terrae]|uniref:Uncharacterized protein n=1 Tax=Ramlibacter terrae TaxID=2732511 RepID=A0ABX6P452_9BURK|nr:hypothetical protein HK414_06560 [Ramlibacter terrae]
MEFEEEREAVRSALQELLDIGRIGYPSTVKVAERVVADGNLDGLSPWRRKSSRASSRPSCGWRAKRASRSFRWLATRR